MSPVQDSGVLQLVFYQRDAVRGDSPSHQTALSRTAVPSGLTSHNRTAPAWYRGTVRQPISVSKGPYPFNPVLGEQGVLQFNPVPGEQMLCQFA